MMRELSYLMVLLVCVMFLGTDAHAKTGQEKIGKDEKIVIKSFPDSKPLVSLAGPGVLFYSYLEHSSTAEVNPPGENYREIPNLEGRAVTIERIRGNGLKHQIRLIAIKTFYYQFVPGESLLLYQKVDSCKIFRRKNGSTMDELVEEVLAPAVIYYITVGDDRIDHFTPIHGYKAVKAGTDKHLLISYEEGYSEKRLEHIAAVQYPTPETPAGGETLLPSEPVQEPSSQPSAQTEPSAQQSSPTILTQVKGDSASEEDKASQGNTLQQEMKAVEEDRVQRVEMGKGEVITLTLRTGPNFQVKYVPPKTLSGPGVFYYSVGTKPRGSGYEEMHIPNAYRLDIAKGHETILQIKGEASFYYRPGGSTEKPLDQQFAQTALKDEESNKQPADLTEKSLTLPGASLTLQAGDFCAIFSQEKVIADIPGPATVYYLRLGDTDLAKFKGQPIPGYQLLETRENGELHLSCSIGNRPMLVLNVATVQYPIPQIPSIGEAAPQPALSGVAEAKHQEYVRKGMRAKSSGDYQAAIHHWKNALLWSPSAKTIRDQISDAYQDWLENTAVSPEQKRQIQNQQGAWNRLIRGYQFYLDQNYQHAIRVLETSVYLDETLIEAYRWLGCAAVAAGMPEKAEEAFRQILQREPDLTTFTGNVPEEARQFFDRLKNK